MAWRKNAATKGVGAMGKLGKSTVGMIKSKKKIGSYGAGYKLLDGAYKSGKGK